MAQSTYEYTLIIRFGKLQQNVGCVQYNLNVDIPVTLL